MNNFMFCGLIWLCIGAVLFIIGLVGHGINRYLDKKFEANRTQVSMTLMGSVDAGDNGEMKINVPGGIWKYTPK